MIISLIVAMDRRRGIGIDNRLPWHLPADLKRFRQLTMGHHLIVGRKTFASIGRPLAGRSMIILSRDRAYRVEGCDVMPSLEEALELARGRDETEVFIGGGREVYASALERADRIYLTQVETEAEADTFFPRIDEADWTETSSEYHEKDEKNALPFRFSVLSRTKPW